MKLNLRQCWPAISFMAAHMYCRVAQLVVAVPQGLMLLKFIVQLLSLCPYPPPPQICTFTRLALIRLSWIPRHLVHAWLHQPELSIGDHFKTHFWCLKTTEGTFFLLCDILLQTPDKRIQKNTHVLNNFF